MQHPTHMLGATQLMLATSFSPHRSNVLLDANNRALLGDLGLSQYLQTARTRTVLGASTLYAGVSGVHAALLPGWQRLPGFAPPLLAERLNPAACHPAVSCSPGGAAGQAVHALSRHVSRCHPWMPCSCTAHARKPPQ